MYIINAENLKWAYKKMKHYVYYYKSSSYLKDRIINFEKRYSNSTFEKMAEKLNEISKINTGMLKRRGISFTLFPKKDEAIINKENQTINISEYNMFIDMPIEYYLVDILFTMDIYERHNKEEINFCYGNSFDKKLDFVENPLENLLLFGNHTINYRKWKNTIYKNKKDSNSLIIKLDIKRCFYNVKFSIDEFIKKTFNIDYRDDPVCKIMVNIYRYYSKIVKCEMEINNDEDLINKVTLPIGLFSSYAILNILLSPIDQYISKKTDSYARYVDDILIVKEATIESKKEKIDIICELWPDIFQIKSEELIINPNIVNCGELKINKNKIEIIPVSKRNKLESLNKKVKKLLFTSLDFDDELEIDDTSIETEYSYNTQYLKKKIYSLIDANNEKSNGKLENLLLNLKEDEWINLYSLWGDILAYLRDNFLDDFSEKCIGKINNSINKIVFKNEKITSILRKQLLNEIEISSLCNSKESKCYFLNKIEEFEIVKYIDNVYKKKKSKDFFPILISIDEIIYYLTVYQNMNKNILDKANELFFQLNNYYKNGEKIIEEDEYHIKNIYNPNLSAISDSNEIIKVAVASMNLDEREIESYNFSTKFPTTYNLKDIKTLMKNAKKNGAEIIVFPEFCLPKNYVFDIIKYSKKVNISIICGLTHILYKKQAMNFVLIRDHYLDLSFFKQKNYFAEEEKLLCIKYNYIYKESIDKYYYVIDNGKYKYSVMTCFEATNIIDRALLCDKINLLFMPVFNKDTNYFSNVISSYSRDASCFIIQSNTNCYGDSRVTGPYKQVKSDLVKLKGGLNNFFVIGEINLNDMKNKHQAAEDFEKKLNECYIGKITYDEVKDAYDNYKKMESKPLSAGDHLNIRRKENID